jgi:methyltransferase (TIGR00027 family)
MTDTIARPVMGEVDPSVTASQVISWEEDYQVRTSPVLLTRLLRKAVPILEYLDFTVLQTEPGYVKILLPLTIHSANQHGVHQAAVLAIAADYAGGIALGTVIPGAPIIGVHPQTTNNGASLWAVSLTIDYKLPSSSHVFLTAKVSEDKHERIKSRYFKGRMVLETVDVTLEGDGVLFASASITYFIRQAQALKPQSVEATHNVMFSHKRKASARLIAGLRSMEETQSSPLYHDPYSGAAAAEHGMLLAQRFQGESPQLKDMIACRTRDIDETILQHTSMRQLVLIGVGLDFRPFRLADRLKCIPVFEIDLAPMLVERERTISQFDGLPQVARTQVPCNLELQDLAEELIDAGFDPSLPTIFVLEGVSMYFEDETNRKVFSSVSRIMGSPESRLWVDAVDKSILQGVSKHPEVSCFLERMAGLGEPFTWGLVDSGLYFAQSGLSVDCETASDCFRPSIDPVFDLYRFYKLRANGELSGHPRCC